MTSAATDSKRLHGINREGSRAAVWSAPRRCRGATADANEIILAV